MRMSEFISHLKIQFPALANSIFNGLIDKSKKQCIGVYTKGAAPTVFALGGLQNSSYGVLPATILVHWGENSDECEKQAQDIFNHLQNTSGFMIGKRKIHFVKLLDPCPIGVGRDENNICEMVIRAHIYYSREVEK